MRAEIPKTRQLFQRRKAGRRRARITSCPLFAWHFQPQSSGDDGVIGGDDSVDDGDDDEVPVVRQVIVGICAMEKKSLSKPMREILSRLEEFEYLKTSIFPEDVILNVSGTVTGHGRALHNDSVFSPSCPLIVGARRRMASLRLPRGLPLDGLSNRKGHRIYEATQALHHQQP